jgi:hypothetical protein
MLKCRLWKSARKISPPAFGMSRDLLHTIEILGIFSHGFSLWKNCACFVERAASFRELFSCSSRFISLESRLA